MLALRQPYYARREHCEIDQHQNCEHVDHRPVSMPVGGFFPGHNGTTWDKQCPASRPSTTTLMGLRLSMPRAICALIMRI
jgi:hypothetical protein